MSKLNKEDLEALERIKVFEAKMEAIPESEKELLPDDILDRMQAEADANALMPEENREYLRNIRQGK